MGIHNLETNILGRTNLNAGKVTRKCFYTVLEAVLCSPQTLYLIIYCLDRRLYYTQQTCNIGFGNMWKLGNSCQKQLPSTLGARYCTAKYKVCKSTDNTHKFQFYNDSTSIKFCYRFNLVA